MSETLIEMKRITKRFPGVLALNQVDFDLRRGEVHALLGENGAGKSTLMKILSGVYQPDAGEIWFEQQPVSFSHPISAQLAGITIIHQEFNLFPDLTVEENIFIGREFCKNSRWLLDKRAQRQAVIEILQRLNLTISPDTLVSELTVAQQQMVEIAKAISVNARVLIMDEPTAALTESEIESLFQVTRMLKAQGSGIVYISHRLEELALIADRATVMRDGQYIATVDYETVHISDLIAMMVGRNLDNIYPKRPPHQRTEKVLEVAGLTRNGVLHDINLTLWRGEILGLAGLMGAGRTELARAIFGADPVDGGTLTLHGRPTRIKDVADAIDKGISYLTEDRKKEGLALGLSVELNIMLGNYPAYSGAVGNVDEKRCRETSQKLVDTLRIKTPHLEQAALNLSGGNQQKIIIARWICKDTDILIFDEPTRGIDVGARREIYELMNRLVASGKSIIMISSELPEVLGMCDRIMVMRGGHITGELQADHATQEKIMQYATLED
ncbi:sugar ABC transporter ATP-binding protein [Pseudenterobacter timonensis]|uniref:sugar ABC transporter ATP-binding protein n=1 Tax=Pseudenterobacter timonensis TaxID=1755099 RepID=UPI00077B84E2|nr:sugar ABC transporter ATP-binding protein [Pseudenterobacter timonensis]